jgi:hypothetical protein
MRERGGRSSIICVPGSLDGAFIALNGLFLNVCESFQVLHLHIQVAKFWKVDFTFCMGSYEFC